MIIVLNAKVSDTTGDAMPTEAEIKRSCFLGAGSLSIIEKIFSIDKAA